MALYTDIAAELYPKRCKSVPAGVKTFTAEAAGVHLTRVDITSEGLRREKGSYITLDMPQFARIDDKNEAYVWSIASQLRALLPKEGLILVAGIGNRAITADALGPETADRIFATRGLPFDEKLTLREVAAVSPGVEGVTGLGTAEVLRGLCETLSPVAVLVIDSLCTSQAKRLGCSVQISNAGLSPRGASPITQSTLGVPVIAMGVPTVMEARIPQTTTQLVITPKDIDAILRRGACLLALAANKALQPLLSVGELSFLTS